MFNTNTLTILNLQDKLIVILKICRNYLKQSNQHNEYSFYSITLEQIVMIIIFILFPNKCINPIYNFMRQILIYYTSTVRRLNSLLEHENFYNTSYKNQEIQENLRNQPFLRKYFPEKRETPFYRNPGEILLRFVDFFEI